VAAMSLIQDIVARAYSAYHCPMRTCRIPWGNKYFAKIQARSRKSYMSGLF
jgi:hypothetical protein